ncbi:XdhC family protein [Hymenobacter caeli]|uniref:Xanthine dehydrogenase accessory factor n=1 Tax=Hymenobacter caeli TaxID=2735894 RepID=A0ABX2FL43_9BACT|nr:XdhC family protein [Hymenobacter caeli]NRT17222.1 xanthine dehydrogenase accessory factor [Hymenobacter caeli]
MPSPPRDLPAWALAAAALRAGQPAALLCVVRSAGSSPGRQGFKMVVTAAETAGSIGGGIMEHKWVELARQRLRAGDFAPLLRPQVHRREAPADRSGMMCSGEQEVLLWPLRPADLPAVAAIEHTLGALGRGAFELSAAAGLRVLTEVPNTFYRYQPGPGWRYCEQLGFRDQLTIVGGGHVSRALARVAAALEFEITVLDDRPDLPTLAANDAAHHRHVLSSYEALAAAVPPGPHRYVVVMTVGYRTDAVALRQLLDRDYAYLGVMGSAAKVAELRRVLLAEGFAAAVLERLRGPIGVPIHSRTPEEIAVSVAAELIAVRNAAVV